MRAPHPKIYKTRRPVRTVAVVCGCVLLAAVILAVSVFFGFKKYIVYTPDGLRLDVPWLAEETVAGD